MLVCNFAPCVSKCLQGLEKVALELLRNMYQQDQATPVAPPPAFSHPMNLENVNSNSASAKTHHEGSGNQERQGELSPKNNGDIRLQALQEHVQLEGNVNVNGKEEADVDGDGPHVPLSPDGLRNAQRQNENKGERKNSSLDRKKRKISVRSGLIGDLTSLSLWRKMLILFLVYGIVTFTFVWYVDTLTEINNDSVKDYKFGYSSVEYDNTYFFYATYCGSEDYEDHEDYWCELEYRGNGCYAMFVMSFLSWIIGVVCFFIISFCGPNSHHRYKIKDFECFYKEKGKDYEEDGNGKGKSRVGGLFIKQTVILCTIITGCLNLGAVLLWVIDNPAGKVARGNVFCGDVDCDDNHYYLMLGLTSWVAMFSFVLNFVCGWLLQAGSSSHAYGKH